DKTKDFSPNALIAFTTFYDFENVFEKEKLSESNHDEFDLCYNQKTSVLTQLEFVLKDPKQHPSHEKQFRVTLYPNSMFVIPLETNRLYTHEIKPSTLPVDKIPTRLGYVIRCSKTKAVHRKGETFIIGEDGKEHLLEQMSDEKMAQIKDLYMKENLTDEDVKYPLIYTSMNGGDYLKPLVGPTPSSGELGEANR